MVRATDPLRRPAFRWLWIGLLASNIGTWMQETTTALLMTELTTSPLLVAAVGAAASLPILLLGLPSGALADVLDRRRVLLVSKTWMTLVMTTYALLTYLGLLTPYLVLGFVLALGVGVAFTMPAWESSVAELVPKRELTAAITLDGTALNVARAVGPAAGGLLFAAAGPHWVLALDALTFLGMLVAVVLWRREKPPVTAPAERFFSALRGGVRYVRHSPTFMTVLFRTLAFIIAATALWALLPVRLRLDLGVTSTTYGLLVGALGAGAVTTALLLPRIKARVSVDRLTGASAAVLAALLVALAFLDDLRILAAFMFVGGAGWIAQMSSLNVAAQFAAPAWVRGRALSVYVLTFQGGIFLGSTLWGTLASVTTTRTALLGGAAALALSVLLAGLLPLARTEKLHLDPSLHWPSPRLAIPDVDDARPVLVTVEYRIRVEDATAFVAAMQRVRKQRLRDGAYDWSVYEDAAAPGRFVEAFRLDSWAEHLRQHERVTHDDAAVEREARAFHIGPDPPRVEHLLAPRRALSERRP